MIQEKLEALHLPYPDLSLPIKEIREQIKNILCTEEYGILPPKPIAAEYIITSRDIYAFGAKVTQYNCKAVLTLENGIFEFPFIYACPNNKSNVPVLVHNNFRPNFPDLYTPAEEILDNGFAIVSFCYKDITSDDADFTNGLAGILYSTGCKNDTDPGKIMMWAWAAMRVMDFLETRPEVDISRVAICGHSRLGKTALVTGALDERFSIVYSNESGCSGAAISRGKCGETIKIMTTKRPFWFCNNYCKYSDNEYGQPFDQHYLGALIAPRAMYISSAIDDTWSDPNSEYMCAVAATPFYEKYGKAGFIHPDRLPEIGDAFHDGNVAYHLRANAHFFSREDWIIFMNFAKKHWNI